MFDSLAGAKVIALDINDQRLKFCKENLNTEYIINLSMENALERLVEITNGDMPTAVNWIKDFWRSPNNFIEHLYQTRMNFLLLVQVRLYLEKM
jgi:threonine dehydrogenase-like Zn-dependent dehydrogenase